MDLASGLERPVSPYNTLSTVDRSFFVALIIFSFLSIPIVLTRQFYNKPVLPIFAAAAFLSLPYSHYAFSRADVPHLAQGIFPMLIGLCVLFLTLDKTSRLILLGSLCIASIFINFTINSKPSDSVNINISGDNLFVHKRTAEDIFLLRRLSEQYTPEGQDFLVVPFWPGAYSVLNRRSPTFDIYPIWPRSDVFQHSEIERIQKAHPQFVLIHNMALDGKAELQYKNTNRLIYQFIVNNFERVPASPHQKYLIFKAKSQ